jgi:hypothetical protein
MPTLVAERKAQPVAIDLSGSGDLLPAHGLAHFPERP